MNCRFASQIRITIFAKNENEMALNFVEELRWRGMLHDIMPGTEELLNKEATAGYIGFDCTAPSLHVGSLVQIMMLRWFQKTGNKPIVLMGGGTTKIGDPSGKDTARPLLSNEKINYAITDYTALSMGCLPRRNHINRQLPYGGEMEAAKKGSRKRSQPLLCRCRKFL